MEMSNKLPPALVRKLSNEPKFNLDAFLETHETSTPPVSIRINPAKPQPDFISNNDLNRVPWCDTGYYLPQRPSFTLDPFFHAGCYYVQEASSMFLSHVIQALKLDEEAIKALDLCAAPGGKSTLLNSYLHPDSLLVSNEIIKSRVNILEDSMVRWGHTNSIVTNNDPLTFGKLPEFFDLMVVDAPCSGSGMFRKEQQALDNWSESAVKLCKERQQRILASSLSTLKQGGILIYSTCSYSIEENEEIADWLVEQHGLESVKVEIPAEWNIVESNSPRNSCPGYRFYPHLLQGEGFFIAVFQKTDAGQSTNYKKQKPEKDLIKAEELKDWLISPQAYYYFRVGEDIHILPKAHQHALFWLKKALYIKNAGCSIGKFQQKTFIPNHALALSNAKSIQIPKLELDFETALDYLRKQNLSADLTDNKPLGWMLACYNSAPLGWIKSISGRINNYYPKECRIINL